jgi:hypothetical protein
MTRWGKPLCGNAYLMTQQGLELSHFGSKIHAIIRNALAQNKFKIPGNSRNNNKGLI